MISIDGKRIAIVIPPKSDHGLTIRLKGLGAELVKDPRAPALSNSVKGNLLVKLNVYPDQITPNYGLFGVLSTENMFLEGWIYRKFDEVMHKLGVASFPDQPVRVGAITDLFNDRGYRGIFNALIDHLKLANLKIELVRSVSISSPGACQIWAEILGDGVVSKNYRIMINDQFLGDPFMSAAILAHELCHVVYAEKIGDGFLSIRATDKSNQAILEVERTVDLLVFMFKIGEFQLRVAKDKNLTIGYFDQVIFERMQGIVSRREKSFSCSPIDF